MARNKTVVAQPAKGEKSITPGMIYVETALVAESILPNLREKLQTAQHKADLHSQRLKEFNIEVASLQQTVNSLEEQIPKTDPDQIEAL